MELTGGEMVQIDGIYFKNAFLKFDIMLGCFTDIAMGLFE